MDNILKIGGFSFAVLYLNVWGMIETRRHNKKFEVILENLKVQVQAQNTHTKSQTKNPQNHTHTKISKTNQSSTLNPPQTNPIP